MRERVINSNLDAGVGFELTENQFDQLGRKHSDLLTIHKGGKTKVVPQVDPNWDLQEVMDAEDRFLAKNFRGH